MLELIVNEAAGRGMALQTAQQVCERLKERGFPFRLHHTSHPGHATMLAREAAQRGAETVIAFGGDGTLHETAAGLRATRTALGIIPCGTGNDFIKTAGIPCKWEEALEWILTKPARPVNSGLINDGFFLNQCGAGFDVLVLDYANKAKQHMHGIWPYLYGVIRAIKAFSPVDMHIEIGSDVKLDGKFMICAIANGRYFGGGIPIMPGADLTDGLLDILVVDAVPRWAIPFYLPSLMMGTLYKRKPAHRYLADRCSIVCNGMRVDMDGEIQPMDKAEFVCESESLLLHW